MKSTRQILVKNTLWLSLLEVVSKIIMFFVTVSVVRYFGATEFGRLNYTQSFVGIVMLLSDFGLNTILIRDIAKDKQHVSRYLTSATVVKGISVILVFAVLLLTARSDVSLFMLMATFLLAQSTESLYTSVLSAYESMELIFASKLVHYLGILTSVGTIIYLRLDLHWLLFAYTISAIISILVSLFFLHKLKISLWVSHSWSLTRRLLSESLPIFGMLAINQVYLNLDTVMIRMSYGTTAVGYYQAAYKILFAFQAINLITTATFPRISALYHEGKTRQLKKLAGMVILGSSLLLVPFITVVYFFSPLLITKIYGAAYLPSAPVLPVLLFAGLLMFYRTFIGNFLLAAGRQKIIFYVSLVALFINVGLNYFLIPHYGFVQGAISLVISEMFILLSLLAYIRVK